jgi:hypothetical protein
MIGAFSSLSEEVFPAVFCRNETEERCFPNASDHDVSFDAGSFLAERPELPSFHGLAGQCFSGVDGIAVLSLRACLGSLALGASRVEECSWVLVGKKSVVSMLEKLGLWERTPPTLSDCGSSGTRQGDRFGGEGVGGTTLRAGSDLARGS